jgi:hypothetical protein
MIRGDGNPGDVAGPGESSFEMAYALADGTTRWVRSSLSLERYRYEVLPAASAEEALSICQREGERIGLVLTDVVMPNVSGPERVSRIAAVGPASGVSEPGGEASFIPSPSAPKSWPRRSRHC